MDLAPITRSSLLETLICLPRDLASKHCPATPYENTRRLAPLRLEYKMVPAVSKPTNPAGDTLEAWTEGFMVDSLTIMVCVTLVNMERGVLLHKLILIEVSS